MPVLGAYEASQNTVLYMKSLNYSETPIFVLFLLLFPKEHLRDFINLYSSQLTI